MRAFKEMQAETHTARCYLIVDQIIRSFECWLHSKVNSNYIYTKESICLRNSQAVVEKLTNSFIKKSLVEPLRTKVSNMEKLPIKLSFGGMKLNTKLGSITPSLFLIAKCFYKFLALWSYILIGYYLNIRPRNNPFGAGTLIYGVPRMDLQANSGADFRRYCREAPIPVIANATNYIAHNSNISRKNLNENFFYSRFPLLTLFFGNRLSVMEVFNFLGFHVDGLWQFIRLVVRVPIACLLWRDYCEYSAARILNSKSQIEAIVITNSNWLQQLLWMNDLPDRSYKIYLGLYSLNSSTMIYKDERLVASHPGIRHLRVDKIWTWNEAYKFILRQEGIFCETETVGPVLWRPTGGDAVRFFTNPEAINICIFDVTPQNQAHLNNSGISKTYYSLTNVKLFLDDLLLALSEAQSASGCKIEILLKHKRFRSNINSQDYFNYVDSLVANSRNNLKIVKEDSNLFSLIDQASLIIVMPFSSPAHIAGYMHIPSIYYDPTEELLEPSFLPPLGKFISGRPELIECLLQAFSSKVKK
jgi:hypothetical protein